MLIGYIRPDFVDLNCEKQIILLKQSSCEKIITEKHSLSKNRMALNDMLRTLSQGDTIIVQRLSTFADSPQHLVELLDAIEIKGGYLQSLKEGIDTSKKLEGSYKMIVKHLVEFQSDLISVKTKIGINEAKQKGIITGRPRLPDENVKRAIFMYRSKEFSLSQIKGETGISKSTLYRYLGK
ncbi:recombinase family protein [Litchfieldia salsa]|uniref:Site-specific DNA recombinase n=1 Tax=Litchfieldia salsa TaxID=930152 RepID=A0A1H0WTA1_9BACI|nr:recombinase family protein [Litchfieldia salsa]SDP93852.1 Site-specific DNA recombinase [Litchfieldia salsa]